MAWADSANWFEVRTAHNRKPATYRCPLCGNQLPALMDHMLIFPEGDHSRRRHAHSACVIQARNAGRLPTRSEWQKAERAARRSAGNGASAVDPEPGGLFAALKRRLRRGDE